MQRKKHFPAWAPPPPPHPPLDPCRTESYVTNNDVTNLWKNLPPQLFFCSAVLATTCFTLFALVPTYMNNLSPDQTRTQVIASFCMCLLVPRLTANLRWLAVACVSLRLICACSNFTASFFNLRELASCLNKKHKSIQVFPPRKSVGTSGSLWSLYMESTGGSSELATTCAYVWPVASQVITS